MLSSVNSCPDGVGGAARQLIDIIQSGNLGSLGQDGYRLAMLWGVSQWSGTLTQVIYAP